MILEAQPGEGPVIVTSLFVGDGDELALIDCLEKSLGVRATDEEYAACATMGDIERLALRDMRRWEGAQDRCLTAMAFHDVRRLSGAEERPRPSSSIGALGLTPAELTKRLGDAGLRARFGQSGFGALGLLIAFIGAAALLPATVHLVTQPYMQAELPFILAVMACLQGSLAVKTDPGSFGSLRTIGDVARVIAESNVAHFAKRGGRYSADDIWRLLCETAAGEVGVDPKAIGRETRLIQPRQSWLQRCWRWGA